MNQRLCKLVAVLAAVALSSSVPVRARQSSAMFDVAITLHSAAAAPQSATCSTSSGDNAVTVSCSTGKHSFMASYRNDEFALAGDGYAGAGTSTAYRMVRLPDRQYIQMTVGW